VTRAHEAGGLATMLEDLIEQNLARDPGRRRLLRRPYRVVIEVPDAGVRAAVRADGRGGFSVTPGDDPSAAVRVRADGFEVLGLASVPLWAGLPDVRTRDGRAIVLALASGRVRVRGLVTHLGDVRRLTALLSAR
jgi:hypothetical protein